MAGPIPSSFRVGNHDSGDIGEPCNVAPRMDLYRFDPGGTANQHHDGNFAQPRLFCKNVSVRPAGKTIAAWRYTSVKVAKGIGSCAAVSRRRNSDRADCAAIAPQVSQGLAANRLGSRRRRHADARYHRAYDVTSMVRSDRGAAGRTSTHKAARAELCLGFLQRDYHRRMGCRGCARNRPDRPRC